MKKKKLSKSNIENSDFSGNKPKRKLIGHIIIFGIVFIMIFSIFALSLGNNSDSNQDKIDYNGLEFVNRGNGWITEIDGINYGFEYAPNEVENIEAPDLKSESFSGKVYVLFNPDEFNAVSQELTRLRGFLAAKGAIANLACSAEEGCGDLPIVDCNNQNKIIYLRNNNSTEIVMENNCIILNSNYGDEVKVINRFMYGILGVIN